MARYEMDGDGVCTARAAVSGDAAVLRAVADAVAASAATARSGVGSREPGLASEIDRFRLVHARLVDAVADAVAALCGDLDLAVRSEREVELAAAAALGSVAGALPQTVVVGMRS